MKSSFHVMRRRSLGLVAAAVLGAVAFPAAAGGAYPDKPIRLVVAFSAGGPTDIIARVIAKDMSSRLGQQIIVDNRPGAGGNIAAEFAAKSPADGYTLLYNSSSIAISPALFNLSKLNPDQIFTPVGYVANVPLVLIVNSASPVKTPADFIKLLKDKPGQLNFGSSGNGTIDHLTSAVFADKTKTKFNHVPYKGNAAALPDLLAGRIDFMMSGSLNAVLPFVKEGRLRAIAATTSKRVSVLPGVPTLAETVIPGFDSGTWQGIVAPVGAPAQVVERLNRELNQTLKSPEVVKALQAQGAEPTGGTPSQYHDLIHKEYVRWTKVVKETGATAN
ncbi:Bug family tripartite tricarboxylate transporter substrate binding protein [Cupriavidus basilensis]|uniref:Bug family tripartite tricarboxylate transporter substrate binding protein n=1 Tax=Cupriavidus basilensis TaxID=68895 RepID=UPI0005BD5757|nr:tripartite tricarboxylate transporter substrate binding protein [Cupriavidus basilensis]